MYKITSAKSLLDGYRLTISIRFILILHDDINIRYYDELSITYITISTRRNMHEATFDRLNTT